MEQRQGTVEGVAVKDVFQGRSVFLTGHTGFKGSWLALWLHKMGAKVHGYALEPLHPSLFEEAGVKDVLASHTIGDVRDLGAVTKAMKAAKPEIVLHLAAQALVRLSYREPVETFDTNVMGTVNVLEAIRQVESVRVGQVITSDKCYENREWVFAYRENDAMGGYDPYSASKGCAELVTSAYRQSFFHPDKFETHRVSISSSRAGNVIGGGDWAEDRIIPDCIRALSKKESILVRNPHAIRPWQHVLEPLSGYLVLTAHQWKHGKEFADSFNFGPAATGNVTVEEIVKRVLKGWGSGAWHTPPAVTGHATAHHEAKFLKLDVTKASTLLSWKPTYIVDQAVAETVRWYRERETQGKDFSARALCQAQIADYERLSALGF